MIASSFWEGQKVKILFRAPSGGRIKLIWNANIWRITLMPNVLAIKKSLNQVKKTKNKFVFLKKLSYFCTVE